MMPFNIRFSKRRTTAETSKEWKPWQLRTSFTTGLLLIEVGIIISVIVLERVSAQNQGLTTVSELPTDPVRDESFSNLIWSYGLLWTALPAFFMALYRIGWDAIVSATAERQPYVELKRDERTASTASRTIMLDYRTYPFFYNWFVAFKMKHFIIGCAMFLSSVLSIALVPLTSHLLVAMPSVIVANFNATFPNTFNSAPLMNLDLQPALSLARLTLAFNGQPPPWTTTKFSFEPFELEQTSDSRNYTVPVKAYYAQLDCEFLNVPAPQILEGSLLNTFTYEIVDRGCIVSGVSISIGEFYPTTIVQTWATVSCGDGAHNSRIVMLSGNPTSPTSIANLTITSCIPSYWKTTGALTISAQRDSPPKFQNFVEHTDDESEFRPFGANTLEIDLVLDTQYNPKGTFSGDLLGLVAYDVARKLTPESPLDPKVIKEALELVWPSVFTYLTTMFLIQDPKPRTAQGQEMRSENRLFVYSPVAWIVVVIMILVAICNCFLIFTAEKSPSILHEEPVGLLGAAVLLHDSDVTSFVAQNRGKLPPLLTFREAIQNKYTISDSKCWYDRDAKIVRLTGLELRQTEATAEEGMSGSGSSGNQTSTAPNTSEALPEQISPRGSVSTVPGAELSSLSDSVESSPTPVVVTQPVLPNNLPIERASQDLADLPIVSDNIESPPIPVAETQPALPDTSAVEHAPRALVPAVPEAALPPISDGVESPPIPIAETQPALPNIPPIEHAPRDSVPEVPEAELSIVSGNRESPPPPIAEIQPALPDTSVVEHAPRTLVPAVPEAALPPISDDVESRPIPVAERQPALPDTSAIEHAPRTLVPAVPEAELSIVSGNGESPPSPVAERQLSPPNTTPVAHAPRDG